MNTIKQQYIEPNGINEFVDDVLPLAEFAAEALSDFTPGIVRQAVIDSLEDAFDDRIVDGVEFTSEEEKMIYTVSDGLAMYVLSVVNMHEVELSRREIISLVADLFPPVYNKGPQIYDGADEPETEQSEFAAEAA